MIYSNLLLPGNFISIDILCIYHLPAVRLEYIPLFSDTEYSFCVCKSPTAILTCIFSTGMLLTITTTHTQLRGFHNVPVPPG